MRPCDRQRVRVLRIAIDTRELQHRRESKPATQSGARAEVAAHAVHPAPGRSGAGAKKKARVRRRVGIPPGEGAKQELPEVVGATADVAPDHVGVVAFQLSRRSRVTTDDPVAKSWSEPLDLALDPRRHVDGAAGRHVAVGPTGVGTRRERASRRSSTAGRRARKASRAPGPATRVFPIAAPPRTHQRRGRWPHDDSPPRAKVSDRRARSRP